ncbi:Ankyrin-2 [Xylographa soralifera]|nr:Ankyrin-2 [Xylographa soralifera]
MSDFIEATLTPIPDWAVKALMWMLYAARPLIIEELSIAVAIEAGATSHTAIENSIPLDLSTDIQHFFGPLIKIDDGKIGIAHPQIRDLLIAKHSAAWNITSHWNITVICITYLSMEELRETELVSANSELSWPQGYFYNFLAYAVQYWPCQYRRVTNKALCSDYIIKFLGNKKLMRTWSRLAWHLGKPITRCNLSLISPLHFAAQLGFSDVVRMLLNRDSGIIDEPDRALALHLAVRNGHHDVARLILELGIGSPAVIESALQQVCASGDRLMTEVLLNSLLSRSEKADLPLRLVCKAARNGHVSVVKRLIDVGASVNSAQPFDCCHGAQAIEQPPTAYGKRYDQMHEHTLMSPLHLAAFCGHHLVVRLLLNHAAEVNALSCNEETPLLLAVANGHLAAVEQLVIQKADVNISNGQSLTSIHIAVEKESFDIVALLLGNGANPQAETNTGHTLLHLAAATGNKQIVELLLAHGATINTVDSSHHTALYYAARRGSEVTTELLLLKDANPTLEDDLDSTPLTEAATHGLTTAVQSMLAKGANLEWKNQEGYTALHCAAEAGQAETVRLLLDKRANIHVWTNDQQSPLHLAASAGSEEITGLLLDNCADLSALDSEDRDALDIAVDMKHEATVALLLDRGAGVKRKDIRRHTALHRAADTGSLNIVRSLLVKGANPEKKDYIKWTPLHYATCKAFEKIVRLLLKYKADPVAEDGNGWTALHVAARGGQVKVMEELHHFYKELGIRAEDGRTPLHFACHYIKAVQWLVNRGAHVNATDNDSCTVAIEAAAATNIPVVDLLLDRGAEVNTISFLKGTALHMAACNGSIDIVLRLLARGADVTATGGRYYSVLQAAAAQHDVRVVQEIMKTTEDVNIMGGHFGSPLGAVAANCPEAVPLLLERGAELNIQDPQGRSLLHLAASHDHSGSLALFESAGCSLGLRDKQGRNVLHHATSGGGNLFRRLLNCEDLVHSKDDDGWTPLHWACKGGDRDIIDQLRDAGADYRKVCQRGWSPRLIGIFHGHEDLSILFNNKENSSNKVMRNFIGEMYYRAEEGEYHEGMICDGCVLEIYSLRFECQECFDFNYCFKCNWSREKTHPKHDFRRRGSGPENGPWVERFDFYDRLTELDPDEYEIERVVF